MLLKTLKALGVPDLHLDLGHVGIFRALMNAAQANAALEADLFHALQAKDIPSIAELTHAMPADIRAALLALPTLYGPHAVLARAAEVLPKLPEIGQALDALETLATDLSTSGATLYFDLAELRGYHYHSGVVFAAYAQGSPHALAQGGRYDNVGQQFGRARCATGFSLDLRALAPYLQAQPTQSGISAPYSTNPALAEKIESLRSAGQIVVVELPGQEAHRAESNCDRRLVLKNGVWEIE